jgi:type II secretory pathway pseudopilin PulG
MSKKGITYIETLIALAVFCIALMPLLSGLYGAYRNAAYAKEEYEAHLQAQQLMVTARDAFEQNADASEAIETYTVRLSHYGVWVDNVLIAGQGELPDVIATLNGLSGRLITVIVWAEGSETHGYAYGIAPVDA